MVSIRFFIGLFFLSMAHLTFGQNVSGYEHSEKNEILKSQNQDDKIRELEEAINKLQMKIEKAEKEDEMKKLLEKAKTLSKQKKEEESHIGRKFHSGLRQQSALNPNISIGGDFYAAYGKSRSDFNRVRSESSWGTGRMFLREVELAVESALDPFSRGKVFFGIGEEGIEVEEAYVRWLNCPLHMNLKMGQFKTQFGKLNRYHNHALPQFERPSVLNHFFGLETLDGFGLAGNFLLPTMIGHVNEMDLEFISGGMDQSFTGQGKQNFICVGHLKNYFDISRSTYFEFGVSGATGYNDPKEKYRTTIGGADFTLKWVPPERAKYRGIEWLTEILYSNRKTVVGDMNAWGFFSSIQWRLSAWWLASFRLDYTQLPHDNTSEEKGAALAFDFWQSEFVFLRFQYTTIDRNFEDADQRFIFQTCWAMGPHKHEAY